MPTGCAWQRGVPLQIRVGLNTGEVVVRSIRTDDLHTDYVPIGHATSLAARLQSLANPGLDRRQRGHLPAHRWLSSPSMP